MIEHHEAVLHLAKKRATQQEKLKLVYRKCDWGWKCEYKDTCDGICAYLSHNEQHRARIAVQERKESKK